MRQIICDRCGKKSNNDCEQEFAKMYRVDVCQYSSLFFGSTIAVDFHSDLCDECLEEFKKFMNNKTDISDTGRACTVNISTKTTENTYVEDNKYKVGDIVSFTLTTGEEVQALAVKEEQDRMIFILYDCLNKEYTMNEILNNGVLDEIYETFPSDIKSLMKPFESGYLRLPTEKEIFGCNEYGEDEGDEVEQFEPMKLRRNRIASQGLNGNYEWWWLANKTVASGSNFATVASYGNSNYLGASGVNGVRPLFLIQNKKF